MANGNPYAVTPAISFAQPGLGQLGQAIGQSFDGQRQQEDERTKTQQFMQLVQQAQGAQDPAQKQQLMTQAFINFPEQAQRLRQQTAFQREQAELQEVRAKPEMERMEKEAKLDAEKLKSDLEAEKNIFDRSKKLRDEYTKSSTEFVKVRDAFDRVKASTEDPDAAGDIALIFNYMKMLDPGSVVREGEFATAQNAGGIDSAVYNMYNKLLEGERLQPKQRAMFEGRARKLFKRAESRNKTDKNKILSLGKRYNLTEDDIFGAPVDETIDTQRTDAPEAAINYLRQNPQAVDQFRAKYGYVPEGF